MSRQFSVHGIDGLPEVQDGDDLAELIAAASPDLQDGDVVVVTSKVVSKVEGRLVQMDRQKAIDSETVRLVAERGDTRIVETRHGFVLAAAGVDASNVPAGRGAPLAEGPGAAGRGQRASTRATCRRAGSRCCQRTRMRRRARCGRGCVRGSVLMSVSSSPTPSAGRGATVSSTSPLVQRGFPRSTTIAAGRTPTATPW